MRFSFSGQGFGGYWFYYYFSRLGICLRRPEDLSPGT